VPPAAGRAADKHRLGPRDEASLSLPSTNSSGSDVPSTAQAQFHWTLNERITDRGFDPQKHALYGVPRTQPARADTSPNRAVPVLFVRPAIHDLWLTGLR